MNFALNATEYRVGGVCLTFTPLNDAAVMVACVSTDMQTCFGGSLGFPKAIAEKIEESIRDDHGFAVIYDVETNSGEPREEYYEVFSTPQEAAEMFRSAFPRGGDVDVANARLVRILGPIDDYAKGGAA